MAKPKPVLVSMDNTGEVVFVSGKYEYTYYVDAAVAIALKKAYEFKPGKFFNEIRNVARVTERRELLP